MDAKDLATMLARDAERVAAHLLPGGKKAGREWEAGDVSGGEGRSLKVALAGAKAGLWSDFATGQSGDLLDLWAVARAVSLADAIREAKVFCGIQERRPDIQASTKKHYRRPKPPPKASPIQPKSGTPAESYLRGERALSPATIAAFKVAELTDQNGKAWILFPFLRPTATGQELVNVKYLAVSRSADGKKITRQEKDSEPSLYGWHALDSKARSVTITEGEIDAMSLHQYGYPALSVPMGAGGGAKQDWIGTEWDRLEIFDEIILCFDNDNEGQGCLEEIAARLGRHRVKAVSLPGKDANECLVAGVSAPRIVESYERAVDFHPPQLLSAAAFRDATIREFYPEEEDHVGLETGFRRLSAHFAWRRGELSVMTGINGHGKTILLLQMTLYVADQAERCCVASMEMRPAKLLERAVRQLGDSNAPSKDRIHSIFDWLSGRLWIYNKMGAADRALMLEDFRYARRRYDCRFFVVDSLMRCGIAEDDYEGQRKFVDQLVDFARDEDCHIVLVAHSRKASDESRAPGKLDVRGGAAITDLAFNCFSLWRNKSKERRLDELDANQEMDTEKRDKALRQARAKPDARLTLDKQRHGTAWEGRINLWFDRVPQAFRCVENGRAASFVTLPKPADEMDF